MIICASIDRSGSSNLKDFEKPMQLSIRSNMLHMRNNQIGKRFAIRCQEDK